MPLRNVHFVVFANTPSLPQHEHIFDVRYSSTMITVVLGKHFNARSKRCCGGLVIEKG